MAPNYRCHSNHLEKGAFRQPQSPCVRVSVSFGSTYIHVIPTHPKSSSSSAAGKLANLVAVGGPGNLASGLTAKSRPRWVPPTSDLSFALLRSSCRTDGALCPRTTAWSRSLIACRVKISGSSSSSNNKSSPVAGAPPKVPYAVDDRSLPPARARPSRSRTDLAQDPTDGDCPSNEWTKEFRPLRPPRVENVATSSASCSPDSGK